MIREVRLGYKIKGSVSSVLAHVLTSLELPLELLNLCVCVNQLLRLRCIRLIKLGNGPRILDLVSLQG